MGNAPRTCEQGCIRPMTFPMRWEAREAKSQGLAHRIRLPAKLQQRKRPGVEELRSQLCMSTAGFHLLLDPESKSAQLFSTLSTIPFF